MKRFFGVVLFLFFGQFVFAQTPFFQSYYLLKKNEPVKVNKILQDKTGFIWFGTDKGLFKFDGISYRRFLGIDNLPDENVTALAQDSIGRLWIGFKNGKISVVEKNVITPFEPAEGLPTQQISDILFDKEGVLWFSTYNDGIYYFINNRLYRLDDIDGMPDLYCYDLEEDTGGNIWAGTDGGVAICKRTANSVEIKTLNYSSGLPDNIVKKILKGKNDEMFIATEDAGLVRFNVTSNKFNSVVNGRWSFGSTTDLLSVDDWMWVATEHGLFTINISEKNPEIKIQSTEQIISLFTDAEGSIWAGSKISLQRTLGKQLQFFETEPITNIIAVTIGKYGDIWFSDGKTLLRRKANGSTAVKPLAATLWASKSVISLYTDDEGFVWAGLYGEGVLRIDPQNGSIKSFSKELRNGSVLNISGKNKSVWLATLGGAVKIETDKNFSIKNYSTQEGLSTDYIYQIFIDSKDRVWFATDRNGIDMLDANGFHHYKENLDAKVVYGFAEDGQERVWANLQSLGLFVFDETNFQHFKNQHLLHNATINVFASDAEGRLIAAHELGMDFIDTNKNVFRYFDDQSGIGNRVPNLNAIAKDAHGGIFIGTDRGLMIYYPQKTKTQEQPRAHIDQFLVNDQAFDVTKSDRLNYGQNNIKIDFLGFWFQNSTALNFNYQLENYDQDWISTHDNSATYSKLPPGEYSFKVKVSDSNDFTNSEEAKIRFTIRTPFWKTNLFYLAVITTIVVGSYSFIRLREKKLLSDKHELEAKVRERTQEIQHKTDEIHAQAEEIKGINENLEALVKARTAELEHKNKALEEYAFINAHQLRAPVASILGLINLMQKLKLDDDEKIYLEHLQQSAKKLDEVVSSITEAIERGDFTPPSSPNSVN